MKRGYSLAVLILALLLVAALPVQSIAQNAEDYKPTPPPKIPAADFIPQGRTYLDGTFLYMDADIFTMRGMGIGVNYVSMAGTLGWNFGISGLYLTGSDDDGTIDVNGLMFPLSANIAMRVAGTADSNSLILFGGIHYSWTGIWVTVTDPALDIYFSLRTYGPMIGVKASIPLNRNTKLIPYYILKRESYDAEVTINGQYQTADIDDMVYHLFGFDIEIGAISIGALLDFITNADSDMIMISVTYNFDYVETGNGEETE